MRDRSQRFYIRKFEWARWHVFMGNEAMELTSGGLFVQEAGSKEAAETVVREYTRQFDKMVDDEFGVITESL